MSGEPGAQDELDDFLAEQMRDPAFRAAYEAAYEAVVRRDRRAYPGYRGRAYDGEYRRRQLARAGRKGRGRR